MAHPHAKKSILRRSTDSTMTAITVSKGMLADVASIQSRADSLGLRIPSMGVLMAAALSKLAKSAETANEGEMVMLLRPFTTPSSLYKS